MIPLLFLLFHVITVYSQILSQLTEFNNSPSQIFYFQDSESILYWETETLSVHRSSDGGKTWKIISHVPDHSCRLLVMHPYEQSTVIRNFI
jgi:hypothetical protein